MATQNTLEIVLSLRNEIRDGLKNLKGELNELSKASKDGSQSLVSIDGSLQELAGTIPSVITGVKAMVAGFLALKGIGFIKDLADTAARSQVLGTVLNVVGTNAGITTPKLREMDKAIQQQGITATSSRTALTQLIQANLINAENAQKAAQLARASQDLAVIAGQNSSETFQRMVTNIQQLDVVGLRWLGIIVNMDQATEAYGKEIGKNADQLSQAEKQQALMNAVLLESAKLAGTYEAAMGDVGKQVQSLARYQENLKVSVGNGLLPAYLALVEEFTLLLKDLNLITEEMDLQGDNAIALGNAVRSLAASVREVIVDLAPFAPALLALSVAMTAMKVPAFFGALARVVGLGKVALDSSILTIASFQSKVATMTATATPALSRLALAIQGVSFALRASLAVLLAFEFGTFVGEFLNGFKIVRDVMGLIVSVIAAGVENTLLNISALITVARGNIREFFAFVSGGGAEAAAKVRKETEEEMRRIREQQEANVDAIKTAWDEIGQVDNSGALARAKAMITNIEEYTTQITQLQQKIDQVKKRVASGELSAASEVQVLNAQVEDLTAKKKALEKELSGIKSSVDSGTKKAIIDVEVRVDTGEQTARELKKITDELNDSKKALGLDKFELIDGDYVTRDFSTKLGGVRGVLDRFLNPFKKELDGAQKEISASAIEVTKALQLIAQEAKSPAEISEVLKLIEESGQGANAEVQNLAFNLRDRLRTTELDEVNKKFEGFTNRVTEARESLQLLADIKTNAEQSTLELSSAFSELGVNVQGLGGDLSGLLTRLGQYDQTIKAQNAISISETQLAQKAAKERYAAEVESINELADAKAGFLRATVKDEKELARQLKALDQDTSKERLQVAKGYYDSLVEEQKKRLDSFKEFANKIKDIDKEIAVTQRDRQNDIDAIRKKSMTEAEKLALDEERIQDLASEAERARLAGDYDAAKDFTKQRIDLIKSLADYQGADLNQIEGEVGTAYDDLLDIQKQQKAEATAAAQAQLDAYNQVTQAVTALAEQLQLIASQSVTQLKVELDQSSLSSAVQQIQNAFSNVVVKVRTAVENTGTEIKRAAGGLISGPGTGTSDSIPMWGSNGEFMLKARAVSHYGLGFVSMINDMMLPKHGMGNAYASGGAIGMSARGNGLQPLNLNIGGQTVKAFVDPSQAGVVSRIARKEALKSGRRTRIGKA